MLRAGGGGPGRADALPLLHRATPGRPARGRDARPRASRSPTTPNLRPDDKVVLAYEPTAERGLDYYLFDRQRKPVLFWLAILFAIAVVILGRLRGLAALGGLVITLIVLLAFVLPSIIDGRAPVLVAIVGAACITFATLYLAHGFSHKTTTALLGTLASLGLTALLARRSSFRSPGSRASRPRRPRS